jgi:hypothetical protein
VAPEEAFRLEEEDEKQNREGDDVFPVGAVGDEAGG